MPRHVLCTSPPSCSSLILFLLVIFFFFFFLMIRRPPRSTLFPTRRSSDLGQRPRGSPRSCRTSVTGEPTSATAAGNRSRDRSEEHTSELQSRLHLVCRLLLEKKKKKEN